VEVGSRNAEVGIENGSGKLECGKLKHSAKRKGADQKTEMKKGQSRKHEKHKDIFYINFRVRLGKRIILKSAVIAFQGRLTFNG
jgi:hypothetical protein